MKNLFRKPLVMGVSFSGLLSLSFVVLVLMIFLGDSKFANAIIACIAISGYVALRVCTRFLVAGWEDEFFFPIEKLFWKKGDHPKLFEDPSEMEILPPDTLEKTDLIYEKEKLELELQQIHGKEDLFLAFKGAPEGVSVARLSVEGVLTKGFQTSMVAPELAEYPFCYSLKSVPVTITPLFMFEVLGRIPTPFRVLIRITGLEFAEAKRRVETSRRRNAKDTAHVRNIDSDVTFEESTQVLEAMSRGEETIAEVSMIILTKKAAPALDSSLFHLEKNRELALLSTTGIRKKHFRSHILRLKTISDLIPNFMDPKEAAPSVLSTIRRNPLYFSPQDTRLESLHWLVVGATGTGKSFFTGAVLNRLIQQGTPMSVLFVDHNRSFRRLIRSTHGKYLEPETLRDLDHGFKEVTGELNRCGAMSGVELSDLHFDEKKIAAQLVLSQIEHFLRNRDTIHPIYVVLDECWNFLRDEPVMVQRAFREFRKLNGAVIAITQSLSDFMSDSSGKSIVQNAPIRILLRQGEDPAQYKGVLGLNEVEVQKWKLLKQKKGEFSECLIKTSFLSRIARLYPDETEHPLLRTDNLRQEFIQEMRAAKEVGHA